MELPKNITQIGESDQRCKVYVEDYVISYIKQMNQMAENKNMAIALYGIRREENDISYVFFYGAGRISSVQKEVRHLSQAQNQEIEKLRKRYFADYQFLGYRLLNGEMVEGFYICEQGACRYIAGYACFYEKNDTMLAYMLESRKEEVPPEKVDQEKFERVRMRQEERRSQYREGQAAGRKEDAAAQTEQSTKEHAERKKVDGRRDRRSIQLHKGIERSIRAGKKEKLPAAGSTASLKAMRTAVVGMFLLLCVLGIATVNGYGGVEDIQTAARQIIADFTEQKIPDSADQEKTEASGLPDTLVAEDKLTEAIRQENAQAQETQGQSQVQEEQQESQQDNQTAQNQETQVPQAQPSENAEQAAGQTQQSQTGQEQQGQSQQPQQGQQSQETNTEGSREPEPSEQASAPVSYTIKKGDTLTSISISNYGTDARVKDICELNQIADPDDIRFGQKILLP